MTETVMSLYNEKAEVLSIDVSTDNSFIAYMDNGELIAGEKRYRIDLDVKYPLVGFLGEKTFLVADTLARNGSPNAYVFNDDGTLIRSFRIGDAVNDVLIHYDKIVVTYFDEGVFGSDRLSNNGLSVFDLKGEFQFGYNEKNRGNPIYDCYCICKKDARKVLFYSYDIFHIIELDLHDYSWLEFRTPDILRGASALTIHGDKIIFHSSYDDPQSFFWWDPEKDEVVKIGQYNPPLRGLENGRFLAEGNKGCTVIDMVQ